MPKTKEYGEGEHDFGKSAENGERDDGESAAPQHPALRGVQSGSFEKNIPHEIAKKMMAGFLVAANLTDLQKWKTDIVKWEIGGCILVEFEKWEKIPESIRETDSPERRALLSMLADDPFPSIETLRMAINAIINLQRIEEWVELSPRTKQDFIGDLLQSVIASGKSSEEELGVKVKTLLTSEVIKENTLPPEDERLTIEAPPAPPVRS